MSFLRILWLLIVPLAAVSAQTPDHPAQPVATTSGEAAGDSPMLLAWFTMKAHQWTPEALDRMAAFHISGFDVENKHGGMMDDVRRGVSRMPQEEREALAAQMRTMVAEARSRGITELTWRLNGCSNNGDGTSGWDAWNENHITQIEKNMAEMARWARDLGFKGLFVDYEIYTARHLWDPTKAPGSVGSTRTDAENAERYFQVGRRTMQAMIDVWPEQTFMVAPGIGGTGDPERSYRYYPDFFAGLVAADADNSRGPGIVTIDEPSMYSHRPHVVECLYAYKFGLNTISCNQNPDGHWLPLKRILQDRDAANGNTRLWDYYVNKHEVAMGMWPINVDGSLRCSLEAWEAWATAIRDLSNPKRPKYAWIYDQVPGGDDLGSHFMDDRWKAHGETLARVFPMLEVRRAALREDREAPIR